MKERMEILFAVVTAIDGNPNPEQVEESRAIVNSELNRLARESGSDVQREMPNGEL
jgi:hypothetical protein